jgi:hypothetical protein
MHCSTSRYSGAETGDRRDDPGGVGGMSYKTIATGSGSQIIIYQAEDGNIKIDVRLENETVWLTQKLMAELF